MAHRDRRGYGYLSSSLRSGPCAFVRPRRDHRNATESNLM
ncbi:hypothetical protein BTZ20_4592 [Rhodococcus sp. MTM3W5.2]|nr:hypothetical protein BTZ20_4592 [Rhodococcus sp. MTM3W5.2]